jgi:hypothetical protein
MIVVIGGYDKCDESGYNAGIVLLVVLYTSSGGKKLKADIGTLCV